MSPRQIEMRAMAPAVRITPKAAPHRHNRDDPSTLTLETTLEVTTVDGRVRNVGVMRELTMPTLHAARAAARESPFIRTGPRRGPNDPGGRSSQMLFFSARCRDRDRNAGARLMATSHEKATQQHDAAGDTEKPQPARMKNDPKSFLLCPSNDSR